MRDLVSQPGQVVSPEISVGAAVAHPGGEEEEGLSRDGILALQDVPAPSKESTSTMKPTIKRRARFVVTADGDGVANHAGSAALTELADILGLTRAYSNAMVPTRRRRSAHDPGRVLRDLVVMLADGGDCVADLGVLRDQPELFGEVASTSTAWRVVDSISEEQLAGLQEARRGAREQAWRRGAAPSEIVLDFDATLVTAHSEKEGATGNFKGGF